ncbi:MAG: helix-turn-helix domain-containing protein [Bacteroidales bacterium]
MTENERIKQLRKHLGYTQRFFSSTLEIKQGSYSDVERGKAGVSAILLKNLIKKYRVNPLWLCEGEGRMFIDEALVNKTYDAPNVSNNYKKESGAVLNRRFQDDIINGVNLIEKQQQYYDCLKCIIEFLNE